jgi:hypothetical protein
MLRGISDQGDLKEDGSSGGCCYGAEGEIGSMEGSKECGVAMCGGVQGMQTLT